MARLPPAEPVMPEADERDPAGRRRSERRFATRIGDLGKPDGGSRRHALESQPRCLESDPDPTDTESTASGIGRIEMDVARNDRRP